MNFKLKVLAATVSLFVGSLASAYDSSLACPNMIHARASISAAQELVEKDSRTYNRLDGISTVIKNALIFQHCKLDNVNNVAGSVRVPIRAALFKCPQEVATIGLVDQAIESLNLSTYGVYGGYRQGALDRSTALSADLKAGLSTEASCK